MSDSARLVHDLARAVRLIAGADEVGRASLAGPIMAAGVLFDIERLAADDATRAFLDELNDSKRLSRRTRERLAQEVVVHAEAVSLVSIPAGQIDRIEIDPANAACLERALSAVGERAELRLVDGDGLRPLGASAPEHEWIAAGRREAARPSRPPRSWPRWPAISLMTRLGERYPAYGFERHKGYGTPEHLAAIGQVGRTRELHRMSFDVNCPPTPTPRHRHRAPREAEPCDLGANCPPQSWPPYLLETPTINDRLWTDEPRLPRETRTAFIRRVLLGETKPLDGEL